VAEPVVATLFVNFRSLLQLPGGVRPRGAKSPGFSEISAKRVRSYLNVMNNEEIALQAATMKHELNPAEYEKWVISLEAREQLGPTAGRVARQLFEEQKIDPLDPEFTKKKFFTAIKNQLSMQRPLKL
jgi:hypothetical protein